MEKLTNDLIVPTDWDRPGNQPSEALPIVYLLEES